MGDDPKPKTDMGKAVALTAAAGGAVPAITTSTKPPKNHPITKASKHTHWYSTEQVLKAVELWASEKKSQRTIAAWLGKSLRGFEEALARDKGENTLRLAYESGCAQVEQRMIDMCMALKPTDPKLVVAWIFFMKAQFAWRDKPEHAVNDAPKISFILPGPMSEEEYFKKLGIAGPIDTRPTGERGAPDMRDVTPGGDGKLPTKVITGESQIMPVSKKEGES